jgi:uncharacterized DUF497 family protein
MLEFEFDETKAKINLQKHNVSFDEAKTVFSNFNSFVFDDLKHSRIEKRELIIGESYLKRVIVTCFTMRDNKIRIINSRQANKLERIKYEENKRKYN